MTVTVVTIDGPSGAGKGTVAMTLAAELKYNLLDSGAVYRAAALQIVTSGADPADEQQVLNCVADMNARFEPDLTNGVQVFLNETNITTQLRNEQVASIASTIAVMPAVRQALLGTQRAFRRPPGLVADGRDMGTVVFPDARLKVFLTASATVRAGRRYKQLNQKGIKVTMESLLQETQRRDERDSTRSVSPMVAASDALVIDSTENSVAEVVDLLRQAFAQIEHT